MKTDAVKKANELFKNAGKFAHANVFSFREESYIKSCKGIANMVVDEVISNIDTINYDLSKNHKTMDISVRKQFWNEVKTELNKL